jgi:hypothetical protein
VLEDAYRSGLSGVEITTGEVYAIDFSSMQQFRSTNRFHRRDVRRRGPKLKVSGSKLGAVDVEDSLPQYWQTDPSVLRANLAAKTCEKHSVELPPESSDFKELQAILDGTMFRGPGPSAHDDDAGAGPHGSKFGLVPGCKDTSNLPLIVVWESSLTDRLLVITGGRLPEPRSHG